MNKEELIGTEMIGFRFDGEEYHSIGYTEEMDEYIDQIGEIMYYDEENDFFEVRFGDDESWFYPAELVLNNLLV